MIDKDLVIKKLEDLQREVSRIEFSHRFNDKTIEAAASARVHVENLINSIIVFESGDDE